VALTVTFAVCDAQQMGLSPSGGLSLPLKTLSFLRTARPEQKTPPTLTPLRISNESFASRKQISGTPLEFDPSKCFRYALTSTDGWFKALCPQSNLGGTTRGPPRTGLINFC
jgi:hypothetical protein